MLLYSTLNHIKYTLMNGDNGIVRTLEHTVYLVRVKGRSVYCLDRAAKPKILTIDPTEYRFKLALVKRHYDEMLNIIKTSSLVGQSIISYLQKKGYPEIALQFVQDPQTRFELAIECGNLDVAVDMAKQLDRPKLWQRLANEALAHGNHQIVEMTYQKLRNFDKLSFLYLATGNQEKLQRMAKIAEHRGDMTSRFQNALYLGDVQNRIEMFKDVDQYPLAYLCAKANGLEDQCQEILEASGLTEEQVSLPRTGKVVQQPRAIAPSFNGNWPTRATGASSFEKAMLTDGDNVAAPETNGFVEEDLLAEEEAVQGNGNLGGEPEDDDAAAGWDMGDDTVPEAEEDFVEVETATAGGAGSSEADLWTRNSPLAADHAAGGSFDTAMNLLNRQIGAVNFAPLEDRFLDIYGASRTFLPANAGMPPLVNFVRRTVDETDSRKILPLVPRDLESVQAGELTAGKNSMKANKLEDGVVAFKKGLYLLMVNAVSSQAQAQEAQQAIQQAAQYVLAMSVELERRKLVGGAMDLSTSNLGDDTKKRALALSAYFTVPTMEPQHQTLALFSAMNFANRNKQLGSALSFANALIERGTNAKFKETVRTPPTPPRFPSLLFTNTCHPQARKVKATAERSPSDALEVEFDAFSEFDVCAASYTPIYAGEASAACPFDGVKYQARYKGTVCTVCGVCEVGKASSGLRLVVEK